MTPAAPPSLTGRDLWQHYRAPVSAAIPAGVVLGVVADLALSVNVVHGSVQDRLPALLAYACLGAGFALLACIGAVVAVLLGRPRTLTTAPPFWHISAGAGGAVFIGVVVAGTISASTTDSWEWYPVFIVIAVVTGLIAGVGASAITAFFQFRRRLLP